MYHALAYKSITDDYGATHSVTCNLRTGGFKHKKSAINCLRKSKSLGIVRDSRGRLVYTKLSEG